MLRSNRAAVGQKLREVKNERLEKSGIIIQNAMKSEIVRMHVIDTGRTLSSVEYIKQGDTVYVGTRLGYARFPALGTRFQAARPWPITGTNVARPALIVLWKAPIDE